MISPPLYPPGYKKDVAEKEAPFWAAISKLKRDVENLHSVIDELDQKTSSFQIAPLSSKDPGSEKTQPPGVAVLFGIDSLIESVEGATNKIKELISRLVI